MIITNSCKATKYQRNSMLHFCNLVRKLFVTARKLWLIIVRLSHLFIYRPLKPERIGDKIVAVGSTASSNHDRTITEDTPCNTLYHLNTLTFGKYQFNCPTTYYSRFDNHSFVGYCID